MRRFSVLYIVLLVAGLFYGCERNSDCVQAEGERLEEDRWLPNFTFVNVGIAATVTVAEDSTLTSSRVRVTAEPNIWYRIATTVQDGIMSISFTECIDSHKDISIDVRVPRLNGIIISGPGLVRTERKLVKDRFEVYGLGSGDCDLLLEVDNLISEVTGTGVLRYEGIAGSHSIRINGSGDIQAYQLPSNTVSVNSRGPGNAFVQVNQVLTVRTNSSGDVYYRGKPTTINSSGTGSGEIINDN